MPALSDLVADTLNLFAVHIDKLGSPGGQLGLPKVELVATCPASWELWYVTTPNSQVAWPAHVFVSSLSHRLYSKWNLEPAVRKAGNENSVVRMARVISGSC